MKKTKILAVLGILLAMGITACNGGGENKPDESKPAESQVSEHTHEFGEWTVTKEPTCTEKGTEERTCACGEKETRSIKAKGHTYVEVSPENDTETDPLHKATAPTCVDTGIKVEICSVCQNRKESTIPANGHTFVEISPENDTETDPAHKATAPTCTETGIKVEICSVCQFRQESTIRANGHTYTTEVAPGEDTADLGELPEGETEADHRAKAATCTEDGIKVQYCDVCHARHEEVINKLGHEYEKDEDGQDKVTWTQEATCVLKGEGTKHCTRCDQDIPYEVPALDHQMKLIGGEIEPEPGKATVRLYECQREGCGQTYLGFKATEVSAASEPHLVSETDEATGDIGKRFWGRPIGNDIELDDTGSSSSGADHTPIFNENQPGDFFEYIFDLTAEQAAVLSTCLCYCDAKPAQHMASNNLDFWAAKAGSTDWTPGLYIDDNPDTPDVDEKGTAITDYRYILYVDDVVKSFDPSIQNKVPSGDPRGEYIMPFVFHLHEGTNKISLRMAGGYRSIFYNFIFRPVAEAAHSFGEYEHDDNNHWRVCQNDNCVGAEGYKFTEAHKWGEKTNVVAATCSSEGSYDVVCTVCGLSKHFTVAKLAHTFGDAGAKIGDATPYECTVCHQKVYEMALPSPQKLKSDVTFDITGLEAGTYEVQLYACASSSTLRQDIVSGGSGRYSFRFGAEGDYTSPASGTYSSYGLGTGENDAGCKWTNTLVTLVAADAPTAFTIHYGGQGYSAYINSVRLVKVA